MTFHFGINPLVPVRQHSCPSPYDSPTAFSWLKQSSDARAYRKTNTPRLTQFGR